MKRTLKRLMAMFLSILMVTSMFTDILPTALAAGEGVSMPAAAGNNMDASSEKTGRPRLCVDFLGDNNKYRADRASTPALGTLIAPGLEDQSKRTNPDLAGNTWEGYSGDDLASGTIFWVGVGIDRMNVLELLRDQKGVYGLEVGFYYNSAYIEPYTGVDYKATITDVNINNYGHQWGTDYTVIAAESGLSVDPDAITHEVLQNPSLGEIQGTDTWKMTYVSLERNNTNTDASNRFSGLYDGVFHPDPNADPADTKENEKTRYVLLLPFVLKNYDAEKKLCLRLARDASHLSMGGGADGSDPYAAWERVTTRNPGRELKLMTNFTGDLNIFTGGKDLESPYNAKLSINTAGGTENTARLTISGDPSPNPVEANADGQTIAGLYGGTGMDLKVNVATGYSVKVKVTDSTGERPMPFDTVKDGENSKEYIFVMPEEDVLVTVTFSLENRDDFWAYLHEDRTGEKPLEDEGTVTGNEAAIHIEKPKKLVVNKDTPLEPDRTDPRGAAAKNQALSVTVDLHADYYALVEIHNEATGTNLQPTIQEPTDGITVDADGKVTMRSGGAMTLTMPSSDITVRVTYHQAATHKAALEVWHEDGAAVMPQNVAQLMSPVYSDANEPWSAYSGVVYHDATASPENHSALEGTFRALPMVDASAGSLSGSLGGDKGKASASWNGDGNSFMALAYRAETAADLSGPLDPYALKRVDIRGDGSWEGIRKNAIGEYYAAGDIADFHTRLLEVAALAKADPNRFPKVDVKDPADQTGAKVLYSYYNVSPQQVQMYLLDHRDWVAAGSKADSKPGLRTQEDARNAVEALKWRVPEATPADPSVPPTALKDQDYLEARAGRRMAVLLEADSAYTVTGITLIDEAGEETDAPLDLSGVNRDGNYMNVFPFDMPDYDCTVKVTYGLRPTFDLAVTISGADAQKANAVSVTAYVPAADPRGTAAVPSIATAAGTIAGVFEGSTVTVKVGKAGGYQVSAAATSGGTALNTKPSSITNMADGTVFTFTMPKADAAVSISYTKSNVPASKASIVTQHYGEDSSTSDAFWKGTDPQSKVLASVDAGTALTADITVEPGYYIYSATVETVGGSFPYAITGNGYNNGLGGGVSLDTTMPRSDVVVTVVFRKGPPPVEPDLPLTLFVEDPDNTGEVQDETMVWADNTATATVSRGGADVAAFATLGKGKAGTGPLSDQKYVRAGDEVLVTFAPDTGYYVSSVNVAPASLGAAVEWVTPTSVKFVMPAGASGVTVTFAKGKAPTYFMDIAKTERGAEASSINTVTHFTSPTMETILPGSEGWYQVPDLPVRVPKVEEGKAYGAAAPGEPVELKLRVAEGWYVDSLSVRANGVRLASGLKVDEKGGLIVNEDGTLLGTFVMPNSDVTVTVHYRYGNPDDVGKDYELELVVTDPDNVDDGTQGWAAADNYASATLSGGSTGTVGPLGRTQTGAPMSGSLFALPGDTVTIAYHADQGYALEIIAVTPAGLKIVPAYRGDGTATFTMPADAVTAEVRFRKGADPTYSADLIFRLPDGTVLSDVGGGTFGSEYGVDPHAYSITAAVGRPVDLSLYVKDGWYIRAVQMTPGYLGLSGSLSGSFGHQSGSFVMPAANVTVNVWVEKLWPDQVKYDLTLEVLDGENSGSSASFRAIGGTALTTPDSDPVTGSGGKKALSKLAYDRDTVVVALDPKAGYTAESVVITDVGGNVIPWTYAPGGIQFTMPPRSTAVVVRFSKIDAENPPATHEARLHITTDGTGNGTATLSDGHTTVSTTGDKISQVAPGTPLTLEATPEGDKAIVSSAYAVSATGEQLVVPMTQVAAGGRDTFAMPDANADAYVAFRADTRKTGDETATLIVSGPTGSGSAVMVSELDAAGTGAVGAGSSGLLFAPKDQLLTVTVTPAAGHSIHSVQVMDAQGRPLTYDWLSGSYDDADPPVWTDNPLRQFTLTMPAGGAAVHVVLKKTDELSPRTDLTAQVVVNDSDYTGTEASRNTARLRKTGDAAGSALVSPLQAGDRVYLDLTVQPGFVVESIRVIPTQYGLAPGLSLAPSMDQATSFLMPDADVVVYVKFAKDTLTRYNVTLQVKGPAEIKQDDNTAYLSSAYSGKKGPVGIGGNAFVQAAPGVEWATVDYTWAANNSVASVTITDAAGSPVPFTQVDPHRITFPMVASNVTVTITYQTSSLRPTFDAVLHVIDLDQPAVNTGSWGQLVWETQDTRAVYAAAAPGGTGTIQVPAGETVALTALAKAGAYIKAAYVLYEKGSQMIECDLTAPDAPAYGFTGEQHGAFAMHPGQNDVYVYVTKVDPTKTEFASVLMLTGPTADTVSSAQMKSSGGGVADVKTNGPHGYVTAAAGETITITVTPDVGYAIDSILMTPLGIKVTPVRSGNNYTFRMPAGNVAAHIKLKESTAKEYTATLHLLGPDGVEITEDLGAYLHKGQLIHTDSGGNTVSATDQATGAMTITVPEGERMILSADPASGFTILSGYVMKGPTMVALSDRLEGKQAACSADFTMPGGNVDAYLVFTDDPPDFDWYTAVLVVTDENGSQVNSGLNSATFASQTHNPVAVTVNSDGALTHAYLVSSGESVTIHTNAPAEGYVLDGTPITSASQAPPPTLSPGTANEYGYRSPSYNTAVHVHYKGTAVTQQALTVRIVDPDSPGDGAVVHQVTAKPGDMVGLEVRSTSTAGAIQTIPGVDRGAAIKVTIRPHTGYYPVAELSYDADPGTVVRRFPLTEAGDVYTIDSDLTMPGEDATLTVTLYRRYDATLILKDASKDSNRAYMEESAYKGRVTVDNSGPTQALSALPNGTLLTTTVPVFAGEHSVLRGVLLTVNNSTTFLDAVAMGDGQDDEYYHTISRADAEVTVVIGGKDPADTVYVAAVEVVDPPKTGVTPPVAKLTGGTDGGDTWQVAKQGEVLTLTLQVPDGYEAEIQAVNSRNEPVAITPTALTENGTATLTMPADNVSITVTYTRTKFTATLHIADGTGLGGQQASLTQGETVVSNHGDQIKDLASGTSIAVSATPVGGTYLSGIIVREKTTGHTAYLSGMSAAIVEKSFSMPADDVDVTVIFGKQTGTDTPDDPVRDLYTATVTTAGVDGEPGNEALVVLNQTTPGLPPADPALWASGHEGDGMLVSYTTAPGYYATVTAQRMDTNTAITVLQQDMTNAGTAAVTMPKANVLITITYHQGDPGDLAPHKLSLTLVGHDGVAGNAARLAVEGTTNTISLNGGEWENLGNTSREQDVTKAGDFTAVMGQSLYLKAERQTSSPEYEIYRVTLSVRKGTADEVTTDMNFNSYAATAAALMYMPDEDAEVTVYYRRVYTATLSIKDTSGAAGNQVSMTDDRVPPGGPVTASGGRLTGLSGKETISTTVTTNKTGARLVGVVYSSPHAGAQTPIKTDLEAAGQTRHDFTMPYEDVTVTVVQEPPDGASHIAKVQFTPDSQGLDEAGNGVDIINKDDPAASDGPFWTAAKAKEQVELTIRLADGYQAEIVSVKADGTQESIYVNRQKFVVDGKTATFTMPDDDATVLIRLIQGYKATLDLVDQPQADEDQALMTIGEATVTAVSNGAEITYTMKEGDATAAQSYIEHIVADTEVTAGGTAQDSTKRVRILKHTAFTGTSHVLAPPGSFPMPGEDTIVSVVMDGRPWVAKVQLKGETDIVGNAADIRNTETLTPAASHGTIWTTAEADNTIQVTVRVARNYIATVQVLRDDDDRSLNGLQSPDGEGTVNSAGNTVSFVYQAPEEGEVSLGAPQTMTFPMPKEGGTAPYDGGTDVTVVVTYSEAGTIPDPYDPEHLAATETEPLKTGYIYGENLGGCAVVTVPTLMKADDLYNADRYEGLDIRYRFYIRDRTTETYTELKQGTDILLAPADPDDLANPGDPYNYGIYYKGDVDYTGARFTLSLAEETPASDQAKALSDILDNDGTTNDTDLFIQAVNTADEESALVQVLIKPFYGIAGTLVSYAPQHEATLSLYKLKEGLAAGDSAVLQDSASYEDVPAFTQTLKEGSGTDLWSQSFCIGSSELVPEGTTPVYMLFIEKPGNVSYSHMGLVLDTTGSEAAYDAATQIFTIDGEIRLIPGDVTGDWRVNLVDRDLIQDCLIRGQDWTEVDDPAADGWSGSIYNPETTAYRCDLNGDGRVTILDRNIQQTYLGYSYKDYGPDKSTRPSGFQSNSGIELMDVMSLILEEVPPEEALPPEEEPAPVDPAPPEEPIDPDFSVDPTPPDAELPPVPPPDPLPEPDPAPLPPEPEEGPETPEEEPEKEGAGPSREDPALPPETGTEPQEAAEIPIA